VLINALTRD